MSYSRDLDGNVLTISDDGVRTGLVYSTTYDVLGRPYDETISYLPGGDRTLRNRYDRFGNGNQVALVDSSAVANTLTFNKLNELTAANLAGAAITINYYANDDRQAITLPNNVTRTYTYKVNGPVDTIAVSGSSGQIAQFGYTYDDVLNTKVIADQDGSHTFAYDGLNRLTQAVHPGSVGLANETYTYDRVSNRKDPANTAQWVYDANNRIVQAGAITYTFDADGNIASRSDGATFAHDAHKRLTQYTSGGVSASYLYDFAGRRICKTVNGLVTWFLWDGSRLIGEYGATGNRTQRYGYVPGDFTPTQIQDANGTYYVHADNVQAPRLLTSSAGAIVWRARYQAYGTVVVDEDVDHDGAVVHFNARYPGQYADIESGLYYNYHRTYDPGTGRYLQSDPLGQLADVNLYRYALSNPVGFSDPSGENTIAVGGGIGAAVGGPPGAVVGAVIGAVVAIGAYLIYDHYYNNDNQVYSESSDKSRQSKPTDAPAGTKAIDKVGLGKDDIHDIKDGVGAGPKDYVGVTPNGDVVTTNTDDTSENHGPADSYTQKPTGLCPN